MSLALVLLVGSGLMLRSFNALRSIDPGYATENVLIATINVPEAEIEGWEATSSFYQQLRDRIAAQPMVESVGFASGAPLGGGVSFTTVEVEDHPRTEEELPVFAANNRADVGYLEAMGIPLLEGRTFQSGDGAEGARAVIVAKSFAEHWWPGQSPLGRRMRIGYEGEDWYSIVGVVADAHYESIEEAPTEMVYWPTIIGPADDPQASRSMEIAIRTATDPLQLVPILRRELGALNSRIPVASPTTMADRFRDATARTSFTMALLGVASGIALLLGLVGI
jgi:hypothetical protein